MHKQNKEEDYFPRIFGNPKDLLHVFLPDVKRNGHHCVQNNDVGPEREEGWEQEVVHRRIPGQEALKHEAHFFLPYCVTDSQDPPHAHQKAKDLKEMNH